MDVLPLEWNLEKVQFQNPRIRALLGSVRSLDSVLESNFAILHCSPTRLLEIWDTVRQVCTVLSTEVRRLMEHPSTLPDLDTAVHNARSKIAFLDSEVFVHLERFADRPEEAEFDALRRTLCVAIGKLHGFWSTPSARCWPRIPEAATTSTISSPANFPAMWRKRSGCKLPWVGSTATS